MLRSLIWVSGLGAAGTGVHDAELTGQGVRGTN